MRRTLALVTLVVAAVALQLAVVNRMRVLGVAPDLVVIIVAAVATRRGSQVGAVVGFCSGLLIDLFLPTPAGLTALAYTLVGDGVGRLTAGVLESAPWVGPVVAGLGALLATAIYVVVGGLVGQSQLVRVHTLVVLPMTTALTAVLAVAVVPLVHRMMPQPRGARRQVVSLVTGQ